MKVAVLSAVAALVYFSAAEYVWPSPYDEIEDILSLQAGYLSRGFADGVVPCSFGGNVQGRQNAAEWIRTAFHDIATYDAETGIGGLDGSIWFELERGENAGAAFNNTFSFFANLYSIKASAADLLAMSVVVANGGCGGTKIPFRAGRIDAEEAGPAGVPEPHTPLQTTTDRFLKAGFDTSSMIALVACGHTLGGIHSKNNPQITGGDADASIDTVSHFDSSFDAFDNKIATEYLEGTTSNLLVVGANNTLNSDKRIFAADENKTMETFASSSTFKTTCADIFARMVDTVPATVQLTDPIEATDIKPYIDGLALNDNGTIAYNGRIRVRTTADTGRNASDLAVHLTIADRNGNDDTSIIPTTRVTLQDGVTTGLHGESFLWFEFDTTIDPKTGISKFYIHLANLATNQTTMYDNTGNGYPLNDTLLYQEGASCVARTSVNGTRTFTVTAAVRQEHASVPLTLDLVHLIRRQGVIFRKLEVETITFQPTGEETGGWVIFQAIAQLATSGWSTSFDIVLGGEQGAKIEFLKTSLCARVTARAAV